MNRITTIGLPAATAIALAGAAALGAGSATAGPAPTTATSAALAAVRAPSIAWSPCTDDDMPGLECGELTVPVDYANPGLGTMTLPVARHRATDPAHRIGSLFTNPGGPGGAATVMTRLFAGDLGEEVAARFDIVGVGPRGIEGAELARCRVLPQAPLPRVDYAAFPMTSTELTQHFELDHSIQAACAKGPRVLNHMSTADVARDMDLARRAVGDEKLTYYGVSYGTYLGETYASLFPDRIRAMVVDGVLDPIAWSTGRSRQQAATEPVDERLGSGLADKEAMLAVFTECEKAGPAACPTAPTIREDWRTLTQILRQGPVRAKDERGNPYVLRYDELYSMTLMALYSPQSIRDLLPTVHQMAVDLAAARGSDHPVAAGDDTGPRPKDAPVRDLGTARTAHAIAALRGIRDRVVARHPTLASVQAAQGSPAAGTLRDAAEDQPTEHNVGFAGVLCSESVSPTTDKAYIDADDRARAATGGFGQLWIWQASVCSRWPVKAAAAYQGPFNRPTSTPVMIIGNEHDPSTPYLGATSYHRILPTSRLVTVKNGFGHGALELSSCVDRARTDYLVTGRAPARDLVCSPDRPLFSTTPDEG